MPKITLFIFALIFLSCKDEIIPPVEPDTKVTAKENVGVVLTAARAGFARDSEMAGIYGINVSPSGEIDLLNTTTLNTFVYIMQSDSAARNEFYVPVYGAGPVKSPVNFNTMLSFIKDSSALMKVATALSYLSTVHISADSEYQDSPTVLNVLLNKNEVLLFRNLYPQSKIDMFLFPSKAIDPVNGVNNSADWVVNFYTENESLVLWLNTRSGVITIL